MASIQHKGKNMWTWVIQQQFIPEDQQHIRSCIGSFESEEEAQAQLDSAPDFISVEDHIGFHTVPKIRLEVIDTEAPVEPAPLTTKALYDAVEAVLSPEK
jgi:hypothetical protein